MGKGSSAPKSPDPYDTASAEAQFNRLDTYSPSGSGVRYGYTDASGKFVQGVAPEGFQSAQQYIESPWEKAIRESLQPASVDLVNRVIGDNITGMPDAARARDTSGLAKQIFDTGYARMAPQFEKENNRLLTNLQARGVPVGADAFDSAYKTQQQGVNDALQQLTLGATQAAGQEQSRLFALDSAARGNAISELVAAMGGTYNPPTSTPSGQAAGVNYSGLVQQGYQNDLAQWQQKQQQQTSAMGTLGQLGGAMLMAGKSTRTAKNVGDTVDIHEMAGAVLEMPIHRWSYKPDLAPPGFGTETHIGPMAEDFRDMTGFGNGQSIVFLDYFGVLHAALKSALTRIEVLERAAYRVEVH